MNTIDIIDIYYPNLDDKPYSSFEDMRNHWLLFVDILCLLIKDEMANELPTVKSRVGMGYWEDGIDYALTPSEVGTDKSILFSPELYELFKLLLEKGRPKKSGFPFSGIILNGLSETEILAVLLSYAAGTNRRYEQLFAELFYNPEREVSPPTVGLCIDMSRFFLEKVDVSTLLAPDSYVNRVLFDRSAINQRKDGMSGELILKDPVMSYMEGG